MRVKYAKEKNSISYIFKPVEMTAEQFSKWNSNKTNGKNLHVYFFGNSRYVKVRVSNIACSHIK